MVLEYWKQNGKRQHNDKPSLNIKFDTWEKKMFEISLNIN